MKKLIHNFKQTGEKFVHLPKGSLNEGWVELLHTYSKTWEKKAEKKKY